MREEIIKTLPGLAFYQLKASISYRRGEKGLRTSERSAGHYQLGMFRGSCNYTRRYTLGSAVNHSQTSLVHEL